MLEPFAVARACEPAWLGRCGQLLRCNATKTHEESTAARNEASLGTELRFDSAAASVTNTHVKNKRNELYEDARLET